MARRLSILLAACVLALLPCADICLAQAPQTHEAVVSPYAADDFAAAMRVLAPLKDRPLSEAMVACAEHFKGTPYVAGTLEEGPETLLVDTRRTDCILFVEMCLAMTVTSRSDSPDFERYCGILRSLRYRDGRVDGYASRLHYTSEWLRQAENLGYLFDITGRVGGERLQQRFFFMSKHPKSYRQLAAAQEGDSLAMSQLECIRAAEARLDEGRYFLLRQENIAANADRIQSGDIISFNSTVPGLDIAHVGIALREGDTLTFIHASSVQGKVVISSEPLADYVIGRKDVDGIRVARLIQ